MTYARLRGHNVKLGRLAVFSASLGAPLAVHQFQNIVDGGGKLFTSSCLMREGEMEVVNL
jgi:hypothetical protein